jgi:hypothetical protein
VQHWDFPTALAVTAKRPRVVAATARVRSVSREARDASDAQWFRVRLAVRGIVLAIEIVADVTMELVREERDSLVRAGDDIAERIDACRKLLDSPAMRNQSARRTYARALIERIELTYRRLETLGDRAAGALALQELARQLRRSNIWIGVTDLP